MIDLWPDDLTILSRKDAAFVREHLSMALLHLKFFPDDEDYAKTAAYWRRVTRGIYDHGSVDLLTL